MAQGIQDKATPAGDVGAPPNHYRGDGMQPFDVIDAFNLDFFEGNAVKYLLRWRKKNGLDDLRKARHYIDELIAREQKANSEGLTRVEPNRAMPLQQPEMTVDNRFTDQALETARRIQKPRARHLVENEQPIDPYSPQR